MTRNQKKLLLAIAAGDGHISTDPKSASCSLVVRHAVAQRDYAAWKLACVNSITGGFQATLTYFNNSGYPGVQFRKGFKYARILRRQLYKNGKKDLRGILSKLTPEGLAVLYMDDGGLSLKRRAGKIHARELFLNIHEDICVVSHLAEELLASIGVRFTPVKNKGKYRLRCGTAEAIKFLTIVSPYIVPCMAYKADMGYGDSRDEIVKRKSAQVRFDVHNIV